jgi:hypothetical protein
VADRTAKASVTDAVKRCSPAVSRPVEVPPQSSTSTGCRDRSAATVVRSAVARASPSTTTAGPCPQGTSTTAAPAPTSRPAMPSSLTPTPRVSIRREYGSNEWSSSRRGNDTTRRSVVIGANEAVPPKSSPTVCSSPPAEMPTAVGSAAAVPGVNATAIESTVRGRGQVRVSVGRASSASATQVVRGSPSIAASGPPRGSGTAELLASTTGPAGRAAAAISASSAVPGRGTAVTLMP